MAKRPFKKGDNVRYVGPTNREALRYGFADQMAPFVDGAHAGKVTAIWEDGSGCIMVDGWSYHETEIEPVKVTKVAFLKEKPVKADKPLPVSNRPAYAVVKDKEILGMFELRADARAAKKSVGGKKAGAVIVAYVPVEEIR
jgi:hypothetical protein